MVCAGMYGHTRKHACSHTQKTKTIKKKYKIIIVVLVFRVEDDDVCWHDGPLPCISSLKRLFVSPGKRCLCLDAAVEQL